MNGCWAEAVHTPEGAISYDERDAMTLLERHGLEPVAPIVTVPGAVESGSSAFRTLW